MANIVLHGACGRMGRVIGKALNDLGHHIQAVEKNEALLKSLDFPVYEHEENVDLVFSAMPYFENFKVAKEAIDNGVQYCDLGGHVKTSEKIREYGAGKVNIMTDIGLAPGLANLMAEQVYRDSAKFKPHTITMAVGGLPQINNPVKYARTWSTEGLLNEYMDRAQYLLDGKIRETAGMSLLEDYEFPGSLEKLEAFITSGAISGSLQLMKERGIKNCVYKTLRHRGHARLFVHLYNAILKEVGYKPNVRSLLEKIYPETDTDMVLVNVEALTELNNGVFREKCICYAKNGLTAMQRMTAFPAAAVAHLMTEHDIKSYEDVPYQPFKEIVNHLMGEKIL